MPRETVHTELRPFGDSVPAVSTVEISWGTGGKHVQLGVVCVNADDGQPFQPGLRLAGDGYATVSGGSFVGGSWPQYPGYYVGDMQTVAPLPVENVDRTGWCAECQHGHHVQCLDDNEPDDGRDRCMCPCGEIKAAVANEKPLLLETREGAEVTFTAGGQFVQLNRKELNELIRKLKRAGKMTFGSDEW